jgi:hypothetical protein
VLACVSASGVARAHHAFASVFDRNAPIEITGTVTKVEWMNPHTWIYIDVPSADGKIENWGFEMGSPNALVRRGWSHDSLQVGQVITVTGFRARDGSLSGAVREVALATGERLFGAQDEAK